MPANYAHYRFGSALLPAMPADARRTVQRFRSLYDVGLHGPDIFFYYTPIIKSSTGSLGVKYHAQTGQEFFQRVCRAVRMERSEASLAYLFGVLSHYCLDSVCHPYVMEHSNASDATHMEIETEFDRFLLAKDGKIPPHAQNLSQHLRLTPGECETVAKFYPAAGLPTVKDSLRSFLFATRLLCAPEGARRTILKTGMDIFTPDLTGMMMTTTPNPRCQQHDEPLFALYQQAVEQFPEMLNQLQAHMTYNAPFGKEFEQIFG